MSPATATSQNLSSQIRAPLRRNPGRAGRPSGSAGSAKPAQASEQGTQAIIKARVKRSRPKSKQTAPSGAKKAIQQSNKQPSPGKTPTRHSRQLGSSAGQPGHATANRATNDEPRVIQPRYIEPSVEAASTEAAVPRETNTTKRSTKEDHPKTTDRGTNTTPQPSGDIPWWLVNVAEQRPGPAALQQVFDMQSNGVSDFHTDSQRTVTAARNKVDWTKLGHRYIFQKRNDDPFLGDLQKMIRSERPQVKLRDLEAILKDCQNALYPPKARRGKAKADYLDCLDELSHIIESGRAERNQPIIYRRRFDFYLEDSEHRLEACLQRTVMMTFYDVFFMRSKPFNYNAEGQWKIPFYNLLPRSQVTNSDVSLPKPDFAVSFRWEALWGDEISRPVPPHLARCLCPDGSDLRRCFPFVFIEVKKGFTETSGATLSSCHVAAQALLNIYQWMTEVDLMPQKNLRQIFFDKVRVFSFTFNAKSLILRVHRAAPTNDEKLKVKFLFDVLLNKDNFTHSEVSSLMVSTLVEYGEAELLPILKETFVAVTDKEKEVQYAQEKAQNEKRKTEAEQKAGNKRARGSASTSAQGTSSSELPAISVDGSIPAER